MEELFVNPEQPLWIYQQLGEQFVRKQQFVEARSLYQQAIQQYPDRPEPYRSLGAVQEQLGDIAGEIASYQQAIALNPEQPIWVYTTLAHLLCREGRYTEAIDYYQSLLDRAADRADFALYSRFGEALTQVGRWEDAIAAYERASILQPDRLWINYRIDALRFQWGMALLEQQQIDPASEQFDRIDRVQGWDGMLLPWFGEGEARWPYTPPAWIAALAARKPKDCAWPKISIVTPSFNQGEFIEETILSVLNQNYPNLEYAIVDGGSTDRTPEILQQYREHISTLIIEPDRGQSDAINKGFARSSGELLLWLNSDDLLAPGALYAAALRYLQDDCDVVAGICLVHADGQIIAMRQPRVRQSDFTVEALCDVANLWATGHFFFQPEVVFSRRLWEAAGGKLDESIHYAMDHDLWLRFAQQGGRLAVIGWPIALFRQHTAQKTANRLASVRDLMTVTARYHRIAASDVRQQKIQQKVMQWMRSPDRSIVLLGERWRSSSEAFKQALQADCIESGLCFLADDRTEQLESLSENTLVLWIDPATDLQQLDELEKTSDRALRISWFWRNHQQYPFQAKIADRVDLCIAAQAFIENILQTERSLLMPSVPVAAMRWSREEAKQLFKVYGYGERSTLLYGRFQFDRWAQERKQWVDEIRQHLSTHQLHILGEVESEDCQPFEDKNSEEQLAELSSYAVSLYLPKEHELMPELFEALLCGQIPIVPADVLDLDRVISPEVQASLPIIRCSLTQPEAVLEAYREALSQFEQEGIAGIERRSQFAMNSHLLIHRLEAILDRLNTLSILDSKANMIHPMIPKNIEEKRSINAYLEEGKAQAERGNYTEAIAIYREAIECYPQQANLYRELGIVQERVGDIEGEIASYQQAIDLQPKQPKWLYLTLAHLLAQAGNSQAAIAICKASLDIHPDGIEAHRKIFDILFQAQQFEQAIAYIENNFGDDKSSVKALNLLGNAFFKLNQWTRSEYYFNLAIEQEPEDYQAYEGLAFLNEARQEYDTAQQYWQQCFARCKEHPLRSSKEVFVGDSLELASASAADISPIEVCPMLDNESFVKLCFTKLLHRNPDRTVIENASAHLQSGSISRVEYLVGLLNSEEFQLKQDWGATLLPEYNNEAFVEFLIAALFKIKAPKQFKANLLKSLEQGQLRSTLAMRLLADGRVKEDAQTIAQNSRARQYHIVGAKTSHSVDDWYRKFAENTRDRLTQKEQPRALQPISLQQNLPDRHWPIVSIITSVYDGDEFIEPFMRHICEQSIFLYDCELIIIDANSPGNESACIQKYCDRYANIAYIRCDDRISIYEAWNLGIQKSRGLFLTNANLDDIRRFDCLELQAKELIQNPEIDIVYSDYAYTLEPNIPFEFACLDGHQTALPIANTENLLMFNSPHCAPMWRKTIHDTLGGFDASFRSAGDMDFWLQASLAGHQFGKIEQTLIAYYHNPKGLSTDRAGVGEEEGLRVIKKYEKLYRDRISDDSQSANLTVAVPLQMGKNIEILMPDNPQPVPRSNIGKSSYFAFSIYKSGSTLLNSILQLALEYPIYPRAKVNISQQLFNAGIDGRDWMSDENLNRAIEPGYYYIGFREYAPFLDKNPVFKRSRKVLLIRDPRDVLVSYYYSILKSHVITQGEFGKSQQDFREQVAAIDIDEFVKEQCAWINGLYQAYIQAFAGAEHVKLYKYEEVIFNKIAWINDLLNYLEIEISLERKRSIYQKVNIIPVKEDASKHIRTAVPGDYFRKLKGNTIEYLNRELEVILKHYDYSI